MISDECGTKKNFIANSHDESSTEMSGFSLMEILIVTGIIMILMAVALPGIQEAHLRSDSVQVKQDIHSLVVAQEAYFLDFGIYPSESESDAEQRGRQESGLFWLTSPIPYIAEIPVDPFVSQNPGQETDRYETGGIEAGNSSVDCRFCLETWVIFSLGPDAGTEIASDSPHFRTYPPDNSIDQYSPTNGSMSRGDIFQYGGDPFWIGVSLSVADRNLYFGSSSALDVGLVVDNHVYLHRLPPPLK